MKKIIVILLGLILLMQQACSERVLNIGLEVYKNDSVVLNELRVIEGNPTVYINPGDYKLQILDSGGKIVVEQPIELWFMVMSDPPKPTNSSPINLRLSYKPEMRVLKLLHNDKEIFSKTIDICNNDKKCDIDYENFLTCPSDCPLDKPDGICIKEKDGICDPDCSAGVDPDCGIITTTTTTTTTTIKPTVTTIPGTTTIKTTTTIQTTTTSTQAETTTTISEPAQQTGYLNYLILLVLAIIIIVIAYKKVFRR